MHPCRRRLRLPPLSRSTKGDDLVAMTARGADASDREPVALGPRQQLGGQPRLPDAARPDQVHEVDVGTQHQGRELLELLAAGDEGPRHGVVALLDRRHRSGPPPTTRVDHVGDRIAEQRRVVLSNRVPDPAPG